MTSEERTTFELIDRYARGRHQFFLAEMFLSKTKDECILCLRPANVSPTDSARFACRYVRIGVHHVRQIGLVGALSVVVPETLERELLSLTDQAAGNR